MPIVVGTVAVVVLGIWPEPLMNVMQGGAVAMLTDPIQAQGKVTPFTTLPANQRPPTTPTMTPEQVKRMQSPAQTKGSAPGSGTTAKSATSKKAASPGKPATPKKSAETGKTAP